MQIKMIGDIAIIYSELILIRDVQSVLDFILGMKSTPSKDIIFKYL